MSYDALLYDGRHEKEGIMDNLEVKNVNIEYVSEIQYKLLYALHASFQNEQINMDKFLIFVLKNMEDGSSIMMRKLRS